MNKSWILTQDAFDALLAWLHPNREEAGAKYEQIRQRLIKIFTCRGCVDPEDLADETINRVVNRLNDIATSFEGEPARYFFGVANKIHLEYLRRKPSAEPPQLVSATEEIDVEFDCLENCLQTLTPNNRNLVLEYYGEEKQAKIDHRKKLAEQLGIALNALRIRAHRIRLSLQQCVRKCVHEMK